MAPLLERPPAASGLDPSAWSPSPFSRDRIRDPRAGNRAAPCPRPTALSPCRLCRTNSRDKRSSLVDPACLGGMTLPEGRRQKAVGREILGEIAWLRPGQKSFLPSAFCLLPSAPYSSTSQTSIGSRVFKNLIASSCSNFGSFDSITRKKLSRVASAKFGALNTG